MQRDLSTAERANYVWINMKRSVDEDSPVSCIRCIQSTRQKARQDYPVGEFRPGACDVPRGLYDKLNIIDDDDESSDSQPDDDIVAQQSTAEPSSDTSRTAFRGEALQNLFRMWKFVFMPTQSLFKCNSSR